MKPSKGVQDPADFSAPNIPALMLGRAAAWPDRPMLRWHRAGAWHGLTWGGFAARVAGTARALAEAGVTPGDRVVIASEGRPEVAICETALMALRAVPVPTYVTNTVADHAHVLRDSGAVLAVGASQVLAGRLAAAGASAVRCFEPGVVASLDTQARGDPAVLRALVAEIPEGALACLIYTSGTGGAPRGVMLPHRSILANCRGAAELVRTLVLRDDVYLSVLPVSHAYEHTVGQIFLPCHGCEVVYGRGIEHLAADLLAVRPTATMVVPRVMEVVRGRTLTQLSRAPEWRRALFDRAIMVGMRMAEGRAGIADRIAAPVLDVLVRRKVRARFGGRLRVILSGGARLDPEVGGFFAALGLVAMQGYGQTEAGPVISANPPDAVRIGTVGRPLPNVTLRIAEDGEILVRGDGVMDGYWGRPAETAEVLRDGWLHTGDVGTLDADGYLTITDRKRDVIVLSGGENVSPARIEAMLTAEPEIFQAVVTGHGGGLAALLVPVDEADMAAAVARVNAKVAAHERVRRHVRVPAFTVENGLLTPTQKVRRRLALAAHAAGLT